MYSALPPAEDSVGVSKQLYRKWSIKPPLPNKSLPNKPPPLKVILTNKPPLPNKPPHGFFEFRKVLNYIVLVDIS